jgi:hypothetical protein
LNLKVERKEPEFPFGPSTMFVFSLLISPIFILVGSSINLKRYKFPPGHIYLYFFSNLINLGTIGYLAVYLLESDNAVITYIITLLCLVMPCIALLLHQNRLWNELYVPNRLPEKKEMNGVIFFSVNSLILISVIWVVFYSIFSY